MEKRTLEAELNSLPYHGRGIIIGKSADGKKAVTAFLESALLPIMIPLP